MDDAPQDPGGRSLSLGPLVCFAALQDRLGELDIPITERAPHELIQEARSLVEAIGVESGGDRSAAVGRARRDPTIDGEPALRRREIGNKPAGVHFRIPRCIPQLGREVSVPFDAAFGEFDITPRRRQGSQRETQRIATVTVDQLERIDDVAT